MCLVSLLIVCAFLHWFWKLLDQIRNNHRPLAKFESSVHNAVQKLMPSSIEEKQRILEGSNAKLLDLLVQMMKSKSDESHQPPTRTDARSVHMVHDAGTTRPQNPSKIMGDCAFCARGAVHEKEEMIIILEKGGLAREFCSPHCTVNHFVSVLRAQPVEPLAQPPSHYM